MDNKEQISKKSTGNSAVKLDVAITEFFQILSKAARIRIALRFILLAFSFLGASWILLGLSDRIWATTVFWRALIFVSGLFPALWAIFQVFSHAIYHTRKLTWLAKSVRKVYRGEGERLLGIIEITEEDKKGARSFSTQIFEAAQQKMAKEINSLQIGEVFSWRKVKVPSTSAGVIFSIILLAYVQYPDLAKNAFKRWSLPFASLERTTLTEIIDDETNSFTVLKNEFNAVRFSLSPSSRIKPSYAQLIESSDSKFRLVSTINGGLYEFNIPPQNKDCTLELIAGDYCKKFSAKVVSRPRLEALTSLVKFPKYLSLDSIEVDSLDSQIEVPENSEITLVAKANREISQILISENSARYSSYPCSSDFAVNLPTLNKDKSYSLHIVDHFGFSPRQPVNISLKVREDFPPAVNLNPLTDTSPVLLFETRKVSFLIEDDFGVAESSLLCSIFRNQKKITELEIISEAFTKNEQKNFELKFPFDPSLFAMEDGDEIIFVGSAKDFFPGRELSRSKPLKIQIIGPEKHAEMIRAQIDGVIAEISEIARNQESVQFETLSAEENVRKSTEQLLSSKQTAEINNLKNNQNDLAKRLNATAKNGSDILNEAAKNPFFDSQTLQEFASSLSAIKQTSQGSMRESELQLNSAAASNTPEASMSMMQSAEFQQKALEELRQVLAKFSEQLDRLEARTLAQRLTKLEKTENKLSLNLVSIMPSTVGRMPGQLSDENLSSFYEMEKIQTQVSQDADEIKKEISRYHERTQKAEYGKVSQLMEEANPKKELSVLAASIRDNISFKALENLNEWEISFQKWAKLLQQDFPSGDSQGGQGGGQDRTADILSLLRIRKSQTDILFKTKTLDQEGFRGDTENWASSLKKQQDTLMIDLTDTQISIAEEVFNPLFDDAHMAMSESSDQLSKEIFNEIAQAAQKESKDILSDLINLMIEGQAQGQGRNDNENLTAMELLMMQMESDALGSAQGNSPIPGNTSGGSSQGGSVNQVTKSLQGSTTAPIKNDSPSKSTGNAKPSIAPEFQQIMEKYFKSIED